MRLTCQKPLPIEDQGDMKMKFESRSDICQKMWPILVISLTQCVGEHLYFVKRGSRLCFVFQLVYKKTTVPFSLPQIVSLVTLLDTSSGPAAVNEETNKKPKPLALILAFTNRKFCLKREVHNKLPSDFLKKKHSHYPRI